MMPTFKDGTLTALKCFALIAMTFDHIDWLFYDSMLGIHNTIGRVVFPIFGFILAYNLARPHVTQFTLQRVLVRLAILGGICTYPYWYLTQDMTYHLNILLTLAVAVGIMLLLTKHWYFAAGLLFLWAGVLVDYKWVGLAFVLSVWVSYRTNSQFWGPAAIGWTLASLIMVNGTYWHLAVIPLIYLASKIHLSLPRAKWAFYAFYPAHIVLLAFVKMVWVVP